MEEDLETLATTATVTATTTMEESTLFQDEIDSNCSTPFVSAPSSPSHGQPLSGYYYSAPTSPMHFILTTTTSILPKPEKPTSSSSSSTCSFEFDFSAKHTLDGSTSIVEPSMSSADELFLNGQIRPMKLSTHLKRPQLLTPLIDADDDEEDDHDFTRNGDDHLGVVSRGRDVKLRDKSLRRRTRSMSPLRNNTPSLFETIAKCETNRDDNEEHVVRESVITDGSPTRESEASSSRSSSVGRNSKKWVFLKEFLYRSKSEGRNNGQKFWSGLSFSSPVLKDKKLEKIQKIEKLEKISKSKDDNEKKRGVVMNNGTPLMGKRRVPPSAHELHYTANRAQAEEMRKKTFLPYRQGLLGCLGFSSKSYGAWNGFSRALNPVPSR